MSTDSQGTHTGWYLVFTKSHHETVAGAHLERQGFGIYLPLLQQHKRLRGLYRVVTAPCFPRYLFIYLNSGIDDWSKVRSTRGCVSLVRFGTFPARVPDALVEQLKHDESKRLVQRPTVTPGFKAGDRVQVLAGVFVGYEGIVAAKNSEERVTLLLTVSEDYTRSVNLSAHQVKLAK